MQGVKAAAVGDKGLERVGDMVEVVYMHGAK
jgi:hypothetical protein